MSKEHFGRVCWRAQQRMSFILIFREVFRLAISLRVGTGGDGNNKKVNLLRNKTRGKKIGECQRVITLSGFLII